MCDAALVHREAVGRRPAAGEGFDDEHAVASCDGAVGEERETAAERVVVGRRVDTDGTGEIESVQHQLGGA